MLPLLFISKLYITFRKNKGCLFGLIFCCFHLNTAVQAQGNVGIGTNTPHPSAMLDIVASDKGIYTPRLTTVQINAIISPQNGLLVYNTNQNCFWYYKQNIWVDMCTHHVDTLNILTIDSLFASYINVDSIFANYINSDTLITHFIHADTIVSHYIHADTIVANYITADTISANYIFADSVFAHYIKSDSIFANYAGFDSLYLNGIPIQQIISDSIASKAWLLHGNTGTNSAVNFIGTTDAKDLVVKSNGAERMRVLSTGNIGIGTASPGAQLEIAGQVKITGGGPGISKVLTSDAAGLASWQNPAPPPGIVCGGAITNYVTKFTSPTTVCNSIIYDNGTNVGINTITPAVSLDINATDAIAIPKGTTAQEPIGAPIGSVRFNTTTGVMEVFNGTCWQNSNTPPIGSGYIQWFNLADPNTIYPCTVWVSTDISNGEFIRATGGLSNVAAPPLTGVVQNFATQDHTHNSSGSIGNAAALTTSTDGGHNHSGSTSTDGDHTHNYWDQIVEIPWDGGYAVPADGTDTHRQDNLRTTDAAGAHSHTFTTSTDGAHSHTVPPHSHSLSITVGNMNSGSIAAETRPTNVAVTFWRRIQ